MKVGNWEFTVGSTKEVPRDVVEALEAFLNEQWVVHVHREPPWWSIIHWGIPSPIVRVDMSPLCDPDNVAASIYEVEVRPAGLGIMLLLFPDRYREDLLTRLSAVLSPCRGIINYMTNVQDDQLFAQFLNLPYYSILPPEIECVTPCWFRTRDPTSLTSLIKWHEASMVPVINDGHKGYLVKLGLASVLTSLEELDWTTPFVVKPLVGSQCRDMEIYLPPSLRKEYTGFSTRQRIERKILWEQKTFILQPFIPPQSEFCGGLRGWSIWRIFFYGRSRYRFLAGLWNWRPNVRVHGASDAILGPLLAR